MDKSNSDSKERGGSGRDSKSGLSKVIYRDYNEIEDRTSFSIHLANYWRELFGEDLDKFHYLGQNTDRPYRINGVEGQTLAWTLNDGAKIRIAEKDDKIIGFMVYHYLIDSILLVRGIYFVPEYRSRGLLARMIFSVGHVSRVFSQTLSKHEPQEIQGEKKNRVLVREHDGVKVWENIVSKTNRRNKEWDKQ